MAITQDLLNKITDYEKQGYSPDDIVKGLQQSKNYKDVSAKIGFYLTKDYSPDDILKGIKASPVAGDKPKKSTPETTGHKVLHGAATTASGFNKGAANLAGFPVDMANAAMGAVGLPASKEPVLGSEWIKNKLMPKPVKPEGKGEVVLNALGEQVPYAMPGIGQGARVNQLKNAAMSGMKFATGAGIGSGAARIVDPENPMLDLGAQIAGGFTPSAVTSTARNMGKAYSATKQSGGIKNALRDAYEGVSRRTAEKRAGKRLIDSQSKDPKVVKQLDANIEKSKWLEDKIPGLELNLGQASGDPNMLSLARQTGQMPGTGATLSSESVMKQNQALSNYIDKSITGKGNVDDYVGAIQKHKDNLAVKTTGAMQKAEEQALKLGSKSDQEIGSDLLDAAKTKRTESSKIAKKLYDDVPDALEIDSAPLWNKVDDLFGSYDNLTQRLSATPSGPAGRVQKAMEAEPGKLINPATNTPFPASSPEKMTVKQLKDFRSQMSTLSREAKASGDYELAYKADQLKAGVNETLGLATETGKGDAIDKLRKATDYYRDVHVPTYRQGATGRILKNKVTGEQSVIDSAIGGEYFKPGKGAAEAADSFTKTFGSDAATKGLIKDYASQSLLKAARNPVTGELESRRIAQWVHNHKTALEKHGMTGEFGSIEKALKVADDAKAVEYAFNKSALAKTLNVDPDKAISEALMVGAGRKQSITRLKEMVDLAKQDKTGAALAGLKAGIGDYFGKNTVVVARDLAEKKIGSLAKLDKFMDSYRPALKSSGLYTPQELSAFDNVHMAVRKISQQARPHPGFSGSPTFELLSRVAASTTSMAIGHIGMYGAAKGFYGLLEKPIRALIDESVAMAVYDPRYADAITQLARQVKTVGPEKAIRSFTRRVAIFGNIATKTVPKKDTE